MNEPNIPAKDDEGQIFRQILGHYDAPSYIRRARAVEVGLAQLLQHARNKREELFSFVRLDLATLRAQAGDWEALDGIVSVKVRRYLEGLFRELQPKLRSPVEATTSPARLRKTLEHLRHSVGRFNERWRKYLDDIDWRNINRVREDYNKYYILEKECALRSSRLARQDYRRLEPLSSADILVEMPFLQLPDDKEKPRS